MRLRPPKTTPKGKMLKGEQAINYILNHEIFYGDASMNAFDFYDEYVWKVYGDSYSFLQKFLTLWPWQYQQIVEEIILDKYFPKTKKMMKKTSDKNCPHPKIK